MTLRKRNWWIWFMLGTAFMVLGILLRKYEFLWQLTFMGEVICYTVQLVKQGWGEK